MIYLLVNFPDSGGYGGARDEIMGRLLKENYGNIAVENLQNDLIPKSALKSNFQNVIYDPVGLKFWVSNAKSSEERAAEQAYTFFDLGAALRANTGAGIDVSKE